MTHTISETPTSTPPSQAAGKVILIVLCLVIRAAMQGLTSKGLDQQKIIVQFHVPNTNLTFMTGIVVESKKGLNWKKIGVKNQSSEELK